MKGPTKGAELPCTGMSASTQDERRPEAVLPTKPHKLRIAAGARILVQTSETCKILAGMIFAFSIFAAFVMRRIWVLETKNQWLELQLVEDRSVLSQILVRLPLSVPDLINQVPTEAEGANGQEVSSRAPTGRLRRDAAENENTAYTQPSGSNQLSSKVRSGRKVRVQRRDRGNCQVKRALFFQTARHTIHRLKLKLKLANSRRRGIEDRSDFHKSDLSTASRNFSDSKAVYMIPLAPNVDIKTPEQLIGPWYIGEGNDFGFNDLWYRDISLDANRTSIIFKENGLHLIYAQVYYHLTLGIGESPAPMGYRIYIKKNPANATPFRRPIPVAECVPSYPNTYYQTCFTQVAWYMEVGDQVYLEHFANSYPMIEADRQGKTFLGIVRLSSAQ